MGPSHSFKYRLKLQFLPHRKLSRQYKDKSVSQCCLGKQRILIVRMIRNAETRHVDISQRSYVTAGCKYSYHCDMEG